MMEFLTPLKALLALAVAVVLPPYIGVSNSSFDIQAEGAQTPIYRTITVTNLGPERVHFSVSGQLDWLFVGQENNPVATSIQLSPGTTVNFIAEIHPENIVGNTASGILTVSAIYPADGTILDTSEIGVQVTKGVPSTPTPSVSATPVVTIATTVTPSPTQVSTSPSPTTRPIISTRPTSTISVAPTQATTISPLATPPLPTTTSSPAPEVRKRSWLRSVWDFFWRVFRR